jgi:hypothetical protein
MLLNEFFGKAIDATKSTSSNKDDDKQLRDELFWFILDHDKLHKDHLHPIATKIKEAEKSGKLDKEKSVAAFMPMIEKGCKEFYQKKKMNGSLGRHFPKDLREAMCERMYDHFREDILKDNYKLG